MPRIPLPPTDEAQLAKNKKEQYEALGKFVEAFELMVDEVRAICIECIHMTVCEPKFIKPDWQDWKQFHEQERRQKTLIEIPFHSSGMTAKPLFDIMRAIIAEIANVKESSHYANRETYKELLAHIEKEYGALFWKRNELLHGTWLIGYVDEDDPNSSQFQVRKYKITADGLARISELPKNANELLTLTMRCNDTRDWLGTLGYCLADVPSSLGEFFKFVKKQTTRKPKKTDGEWQLFLTENSAGTTLPKK
jgi:hypothetical protein